MLLEAHGEGRLEFFGEHAALAGEKAFKAFLAPLWNSEWVVYAKKPFAGPEAVLPILARYTHRVAISNSLRLICIRMKVASPSNTRIYTASRGQSVTRP